VLLWRRISMANEKHNIQGHTTKEAADIVGVTPTRIRQLVSQNKVDHFYVADRLMITERGIEQAKARRTTVGRPPKVNKNGRKAA
jgi:predicted transcriptional regulator of viral defense system